MPGKKENHQTIIGGNSNGHTDMAFNVSNKTLGAWKAGI